MKFLLLMVKNVRRNLLRSILTALGTMVLVFVVTLIWSVLSFLDRETEAKSKNLKAIVTERWQLPSRLPFSYASSMQDFAWQDPADPRAAWLEVAAAKAAGDAAAAAAAQAGLDGLLREPGAADRVAEFAALTRGRYAAPKRLRGP